MKTTLWGITIMLAPIIGTFTFACAPSRPTSVRDDGDATDGLHAEDELEIPCAPRRVLKTVCQRCHTRPTLNGAPFPLMWRTDVLRPYGGVAIRELMIGELTVGRMPLAPVTMSPADREVLLTWLRAGAPPIPASSCNDADANTQDGSGGGETTDGSTDDGGLPGPDSGEPDAGEGDAESEAGQ
jgi:hypothetical protein